MGAGWEELQQRWDDAKRAGAAGGRPEGWGGYRIEAEVLEFWHGRENRLHDRIRFTRAADGWRRDRLAP